MTPVETLQQLEALGTAQNRKIYARHGVDGPQYGVSYGNLGKLQKKIKTDHALARDLWASGNHDARVLATMIADPAQMTRPLLDAWAYELDNYVLTDAFSKLAAGSPVARPAMEAWTGSEEEWIGTAGFNVLAQLALAESDLQDAYFEPYLAAIEQRIHDSKNRVRYAMNNALIAIGVRSPALEAQAVAAAGRIGAVEVDHGQTGCKTPDAASYIKKTVQRKRQRQAERA